MPSLGSIGPSSSVPEQKWRMEQFEGRVELLWMPGQIEPRLFQAQGEGVRPTVHYWKKSIRRRRNRGRSGPTSRKDDEDEGDDGKRRRKRSRNRKKMKTRSTQLQKDRTE